MLTNWLRGYEGRSDDKICSCNDWQTFSSPTCPASIVRHTGMRLTTDGDMVTLVTNGENKADYEDDNCNFDYKTLVISDFQKFKMMRDEQLRRKLMLGVASFCLAITCILSLYSVYTVSQLADVAQTIHARITKEEELSFQNSVKLQLQGEPNLVDQEMFLIPTAQEPLVSRLVVL